MFRIARSTLAALLAAGTAAVVPATPASAFPLSVTWLGSGTVSCTSNMTTPCTVNASSSTCVEADTSALFSCSVSLSGTVLDLTRSTFTGACLSEGVGSGWVMVTDQAGATATIPVLLVTTSSGATYSIEIVSSSVHGVLATQCQLGTSYVFTGTYHL